MMGKFSCQPVNVNIIQIYLTSSEAENEEIETCYAQLEQIVITLPNRK